MNNQAIASEPHDLGKKMYRIDRRHVRNSCMIDSVSLIFKVFASIVIEWKFISSRFVNI